MNQILDLQPTRTTLTRRQRSLIRVAATLHGLSDCLRLDLEAGESSDQWREHLATELSRLSREVDRLVE